MNFTKYLSLLTTIVITVLAFITLYPMILGEYVLSSSAQDYLDKFYFGAGALIIVCLSIFFKRNIWVYLFAITLMLTFLGVISLHGISFSFKMGSFDFNLITVLLMLLHFSFNVDAFMFRKVNKK